MNKGLIKSIKKISEKVNSKRIVIITNHLKIDGNLYIENGKCEECHDNILTLENALICRLNDYCTCDGDNCNCNDYVCFRYDWLNINIDNICAYSMISE